MADGANPFLSDEWLALQEKYWNAWGDLYRTGTAGAIRPEEPALAWSKALDQWWQAVSSKAPDPVQNFYGHLINQGKSFFQLSQGLSNLLSGNAAAAGSMEEWRRAVERSMSTMKESLGGAGGKHTGMRELMAFWELPMDTWQRTASVMSGMPGDLMETFKADVTGKEPDLVREHLTRFLSVPALGYTRESQEQYQTLQRLALDYQYALQEYAAQYAEIGAKSVDRLQSKLIAGEAVGTLQDLYNLWVDACEETYAEHVSGEEYARVHGHLVNSLMALKKHSQALVDEVLGMMNAPTRREMDTLQERFQELRREVRAVNVGREAQAPRPASKTRSKAPPASERTTRPTTKPRKPVVAEEKTRAAAPAAVGEPLRKNAAANPASPKKTPPRRKAAGGSTKAGTNGGAS